MDTRAARLKPIQLLLVTQEDPFYLPLFFDRFLANTKDKALAIAILPPLNSSLLLVAKDLYNLYGLKDFLRLCLRYLKARLLDLATIFLPLKGLYSIKAAARKYSLPILKPKDINSRDFLKYIKDTLKPELIVSISASQVFSEELLRLPPLGCVNLHAGPLPRYAGMMPTFWVLAKDEKETAVTLHTMTKKLDEGQILMQKQLPISSEDTLHSLVLKNKELGYKIVLQFLEDLRLGTVKPIPYDSGQRSYYHFPGRKDALEFRKKGKRFY